VNEPAVEETMYEGSSILSLKPEVLDHEHVSQVEAKLKSMNKAGNKKILLDLRDVAAGNMTEAVRMANLFLSSGTIATLQGQTFAKQTFTAESKLAVNATAPLVVLVNRGTAGPGELVAAAILDNKRGDLVGEKTFGEGSLQKTFDLADGSAVILSIAKYASPAGKKYEDDAVTPGTLVASSADLFGDDDEGESAEGQPTGTPKKLPDMPKKPTVTVDDQLNKALEMLKAKAA
jgi:carboxyl-terminal processing protease